MPYSRVPRANRGEPLEEREIAAVELLCDGMDGAQIAARLAVDPSCVTRRLKRARDKLGAATLPELAVKYDRLRRG